MLVTYIGICVKKWNVRCDYSFRVSGNRDIFNGSCADEFGRGTDTRVIDELHLHGLVGCACSVNGSVSKFYSPADWAASELSSWSWLIIRIISLVRFLSTRKKDEVEAFNVVGVNINAKFGYIFVDTLKTLTVIGISSCIVHRAILLNSFARAA